MLSVGRIHPDKGQLDLVRSYREQVFEPFGLPLHLVGGVDDPGYYDAVAGHVDGVSVISTVDADRPSATSGWLPAREIAELCNRARLFVSSSPHERFGMALIEAMACGTTCVVNGHYSGFAEAELRPRVHGNITRQEGSILELVAQALAGDVRIDGSDWAMQYSVRSAAPGGGALRRCPPLGARSSHLGTSGRGARGAAVVSGDGRGGGAALLDVGCQVRGRPPGGEHSAIRRGRSPSSRSVRC